MSVVCCLSVTLCISAKRYVLEQQLLLTSRIWEIDWYQMNDFDLRLEVVSRSCQPLRYIRRWISRKPLEIEAWFQRTTNRKWHMGYQMVTWPMTSRNTQRCYEAVRSAILATAWLLVKNWRLKTVKVAISDESRQCISHPCIGNRDIEWQSLS